MKNYNLSDFIDAGLQRRRRGIMLSISMYGVTPSKELVELFKRWRVEDIQVLVSTTDNCMCLKGKPIAPGSRYHEINIDRLIKDVLCYKGSVMSLLGKDLTKHVRYVLNGEVDMNNTAVFFHEDQIDEIPIQQRHQEVTL